MAEQQADGTQEPPAAPGQAGQEEQSGERMKSEHEHANGLQHGPGEQQTQQEQNGQEKDADMLSPTAAATGGSGQAGGADGQQHDGTGSGSEDDMTEDEKPTKAKSARARKPHLQGRFSGRLATKEDEKRLAQECRALAPLVGGVGKRGDRSRLTLAKIVRGIATGDVRRHLEGRESVHKTMANQLAELQANSSSAKIMQLQQEITLLRREKDQLSKRATQLEAKLQQQKEAAAAAAEAGAQSRRSAERPREAVGLGMQESPLPTLAAAHGLANQLHGLSGVQALSSLQGGGLSGLSSLAQQLRGQELLAAAEAQQMRELQQRLNLQTQLALAQAQVQAQQQGGMGGMGMGSLMQQQAMLHELGQLGQLQQAHVMYDEGPIVGLDDRLGLAQLRQQQAAQYMSVSAGAGLHQGGGPVLFSPANLLASQVAMQPQVTELGGPNPQLATLLQPQLLHQHNLG